MRFVRRPPAGLAARSPERIVGRTRLRLAVFTLVLVTALVAAVGVVTAAVGGAGRGRGSTWREALSTRAGRDRHLGGLSTPRRKPIPGAVLGSSDPSPKCLHLDRAQSLLLG